jgi:hypothetical protein
MNPSDTCQDPPLRQGRKRKRQTRAFYARKEDAGHPEVLCYVDTRWLANRLARREADKEQRLMYVLEGYRPSSRGFRVPVYYVSRISDVKLDVEGLPSPESVGPPYSRPLLVDEVGPRGILPRVKGPGAG